MERFKTLLLSKQLRAGLALFVLALTVVVFVHFFMTHPAYIHVLGMVSAWTILWIILLDAATVGALVFVYNFLLRLLDEHMTYRDQFLLTSYSSLWNFLGPLQSAAGMRAVYLKSRLGIRARDYVRALLFYYAFFALISSAFLFGGGLVWWQALFGVIVVGIICYVVIKWFARRRAVKSFQLYTSSRAMLGLFLATLAQVICVTAYYGIELTAVQAHASIGQIIAYSGAANFAIFVAITPDAIGIRESFLKLSQRLHHVSNGHILSANLLDHAVYALFLLILAMVVASFHAKKRFDVRADRTTV
jgi:uncharacterized membrane protein YbhN (UPF0104 family)